MSEKWLNYCPAYRNYLLPFEIHLLPSQDCIENLYLHNHYHRSFLSIQDIQDHHYNITLIHHLLCYDNLQDILLLDLYEIASPVQIRILRSYLILIITNIYLFTPGIFIVVYTVSFRMIASVFTHLSLDHHSELDLMH